MSDDFGAYLLERPEAMPDGDFDHGPAPAVGDAWGERFRGDEGRDGDQDRHRGQPPGRSLPRRFLGVAV